MKLMCKKGLECQSHTDAGGCTACEEMYKQGRERCKERLTGQVEKKG